MQTSSRSSEITGIVASIQTSEELRNLVSFKYLQCLAETITEPVIKRYPELAELRTIFFDSAGRKRLYDIKNQYGDLYSYFLTKLQIQIENIRKDQNALMENVKNQEDALFAIALTEPVDRMIDAIYANNNHILEYA